jgi:hypothetical protein
LSWKRSRTKRLILMLVVALVASSSAYAYTANVGVPASNAGYGTGAVNPIAVSGNAQFSLSWTGNPADVTQVTFNVTPASVQTVDMQLSNDPTWYSCSVSGGSVTCTPTSPTQAVVTTGLNQLTVVGAD